MKKPKAKKSAIKLRKWEVKPAFGEPSEIIQALDWHLSDGRIEFTNPQDAAECCAIFQCWQWFRELKS
jgi:hypothetical protein